MHTADTIGDMASAPPPQDKTPCVNVTQMSGKVCVCVCGRGGGACWPLPQLTAVLTPYTSDLVCVSVKELNVIGSRCGNFSMALECLASGRIDVCKYITAQYPLTEGVKAIRHAGQHGALKIQLIMEEDN